MLNSNVIQCRACLGSMRKRGIKFLMFDNTMMTGSFKLSLPNFKLSPWLLNLTLGLSSKPATSLADFCKVDGLFDKAL